MATSHRLIGSGSRKVLALHGWFGSAAGWGSLPQYLDTDTYTWAFLDYRGYGEAKEHAGEHTMEEISDDALSLADELGWDTFDLVGHSMGGMAVQRVLLDAPERVRRLVGISPVPASGVPFDERSWALFSGAAGNRENRAAIIDLTTGNRLSRTFVDAVVQHSLDESTVEAFGDYLTAWAKTDFADKLQGNETPVKVLVGENDPAMSADVMRQTWLQTYPSCELEVLTNAGHYAMFETPVALVTSVEEFLGRP
ncbi:MAG: alpha/beta fold hydrolase [Actinomycetes bacterium]